MMLVVPGMYYHSFIELYFEYIPTVKEPYGTNCSCYRGDTGEYTGRFYKGQLQSILSTKVLAAGKIPHYTDLAKVLRVEEAIIFHVDDCPGVNMGPIHALMLQLLGKEIIALGVSDSTKIGTFDLSDSHVILTLPNGKIAQNLSFPAYTIDSYWEGLNWI